MRPVDLYDGYGQSLWVDGLERTWLSDGTLQRLLDIGVRGLITNPTTLQTAFSNDRSYLKAIAATQASAKALYWDLIVEDARRAAELLKPIWLGSNGEDGFVSIDIDPHLHDQAQAIVAAAMELTNRVRAPNLMVKIPATPAGIEAIEGTVSRGISINATLIFSTSCYEKVAKAYLTGLEHLRARAPEKLSQLASVASVVLSHTDVAVDSALLEAEAPIDSLGKAGIAVAKTIYQSFLDLHTTPLWRRLGAHGAHQQRPLWAYAVPEGSHLPSSYYVNALIGPQTVTALPFTTMKAIVERTVLAPSLLAGVDEAACMPETLASYGVQLAPIMDRLLDDRIASCISSYDTTLETLANLIEKNSR
ncbi:MAG: transaldolase family protein [Ferrimicrobium sp.]